MAPEELIYLGRKVRDAGGHLLYGTYDGIPKSKALELGLIAEDNANRPEPAPKSAKATPARTRARKPSENR